VYRRCEFLACGNNKEPEIAVEDYGYQSAALFAIISSRSSLNK
jgi:hypothetical protein